MELTWTSIAEWLLRTAGGGSLLIVGTLLAMRCVRQPARRQRLGELGMAAALVLAALCWAPAWLPLWAPAPTVPPTVDWVIAPVEEAMPEWLIAEFAQQDGALAAPAVAALKVPEIAPGSSPDWLLPAAVIAYGLGAAFYLARWLAGVVALWHIVRAAQPATPDLLAALDARWSGRRRPRLLISTKLPVPASCGIFRPTLILPAALAAPDRATQRDWIFDHELTHLARRDPWSAVLFALGQMLYFVLPWFWWLKRLVRLCQEYVADAAACRRRPADEYAEFLLSLTSSPAAPLAATGVTGTSSDLYRRVTMLLQNPVRVELSCPRVWTVGAAGVLLGLAVLAAGIGPAQAQPPNQKEVLEQLERIQDMVNKLRHQIADQPKLTIRKADEPGAIVVDVDVKKKVDAQVRDAKKAANEAAERALVLVQQHARALAQAKEALAAAAAQKDGDKKHFEVERAAAERQRAVDQYVRALTIKLTEDGQVQRGPADKELKAVLELLQKHLADLKDSDANTKQIVQDAVNRLKEAMKRQATPPAPVLLPRAVPAKPGKIVTVPAVPGQPAAPAIPAVPAPPKSGVIVTAPDARAIWVERNARLGVISGDGDKPKVWAVAFAPAQGRLGIRVDAPSAALAEQLNLPKDQGLVVSEVFDKSIAQKAGLKANDILLKINQLAVASDPEKLVKQVADIKADTPFDIVVLRRGKQETIQNVRLPEPSVRVHSVTGWGVLGGFDNAQIKIAVTRTGKKLTLLRNDGPLAITMHAETADGKTKVTSIRIEDKGTSSKYDSIQMVPEPHRAKVQHLLQLLDSAEQLPNRFEYRVVPQKTTPAPKPMPIQELLVPQGNKPASAIPNLNERTFDLTISPNLNRIDPAHIDFEIVLPKPAEPKKAPSKP